MMRRQVLLIKLTSFGDLIHVLPALTDAYLANKECLFDWVIDENFQEVAHWHPAVDRVFTTNHREWRGCLMRLKTYRALKKLVHSIRKEKYDFVIDGQGNFKTASLALFTKGLRVGYDRHSVREPIAAIAYQKTFAISRKMHAIERLRRLFAYALEYPLPNTPPNFLINREKFTKPNYDLPAHYFVFVHNASWKTKLWPEEYWKELIQRTTQEGYTILLPWGNEEEKARANRLAISEQVQVLPKLNLSELGYILAQSQGNVCVDTGLSHLSAALNVPSITLYGSTDSGLIGASGFNQTYVRSSLPCAPCNKKKCMYPQTPLSPPCLAELKPQRIFNLLMQR
jgi:heptosyltransferase I